MAYELDHLFICTTADAPEAALLRDFGLTEGSPNTHPGQGTANRRFFFRNAMLELLWVHSEREARSSLVAPTRLWERWHYRSTGHSPFGICLRPSAERAATQSVLPFATWAYRPPYLPAGLHIDVATETADGEPMLFATPFSGRPDAAPVERRQPLVHPRGFGEITALRITLARSEPTSRPLRAVQRASFISFDLGSAHLAEVEFDHAARGQSTDFRPDLPLRFRW